MVAQNTVRKFEVNKVFLFFDGICYIEGVVKLDCFSEKTYFTSYVRNMFWATILYKYKGNNLKLENNSSK